MEDLGLLARDFGIRPQGKSAPMAASRSSALGGSVRTTSSVPSWNKPRSGSSTDDPFFGGGVGGGGISADRIPSSYEDVFGGPPQKSASPPSIDSIFDGFKDPAPKASSMPVYDKPVYDDDIFVGIPGVKSSSSARYVDVFESLGSTTESVSSPPYDDLLENLGRGMPDAKSSGDRQSLGKKDKDASGFEELLPGFGVSSQQQKRQEPAENHQKSVKTTTAIPVDPFVDLHATSVHQSSGSSDDPLEQISQSMSSGGTNIYSASVGGVGFDDFDGLGKPIPSFSSGVSDTRKDKIMYEANQDTNSGFNFSEESHQRSSVDTVENTTLKSQPTRATEFQNSVGRHSSRTANTFEQNFAPDQSSNSFQHPEAVEALWLTVSEIPLFTKPTSAPPPSRPPPPIAGKKPPFFRIDEPASPSLSGRRVDTDSLSQPNQSYSYTGNSIKRSNISSIDELEDFSKVKPQKYPNENAEVFAYEEDIDANLRDAMGKAEAKFRHAKEVRERERDAKVSRNKDHVHYPSAETSTAESQYTEDQEKQEQLERELLQKERDEKEEQQRKLEKERELERERERERARQAVERVTREARERAAAEARQKAERAAAEKARQQAERLAFQRAAAEARERAANEARDRAEKAKATAEAREKAAAEAREKAAERAAAERAAAERAAAEARQRAAERAAVERVAAEARDRAAAEARARAAVAANEKQNNTDNDLESFFGMGSRASSAPKQRSATADNIFDSQFQSRGAPEARRSSSSSSNTNLKKASSVTNIADDLSSIFGASPSPGEFQEVDGETEERRRARFERHQRTRERAAKALAEKNERDMQMQRDQAERNRMSETLDFEIKRWAAGKEGNLRALLSTLQYVLWPECGWQPVSLTDLITAASVKKVYRKATLCIHPDKVQQKGANLQQKYIAEKVFDLLKEAWNKFNSEELF
ncbi:auxilin-related protein 1-like [Phalaenopsis equestris]|uniref:auxilin-related protein 1-like n=1 Tax=Phalaenopsis equestris TaxID=78828 RepID=UPI0009E3AF9A|nr:auxilin-related protein 1-like [Phalaenopsis equestris]